MKEPYLSIPDAETAAAIAAKVTGHAPTGVLRFGTGSCHYVFDVGFADRKPVAVRIGTHATRDSMSGAAYLFNLLRPLGVPLPAILGADTGTEFPWLVLERLSGTDLGVSMSGLSHSQLDDIARRVAAAQAATAETESAGRFGYAVRPEQAPHAAWSQVLDANLARSRKRMAAANLFEVGMVDAAMSLAQAMRPRTDEMAAIPFLHDTTTKNVIVGPDGRLSGIVDVDDLCFGDPRYPAALTLAALSAYGGPGGYVSAWLRHAGQRDDPLFRLYVTIFLLDLMSEHGQTFNGNEPTLTPQSRSSLIRAFEHNFRLATQ